MERNQITVWCKESLGKEFKFGRYYKGYVKEVCDNRNVRVIVLLDGAFEKHEITGSALNRFDLCKSESTS